MPGANGLKDIYDCYDKENQTDAHAQSKKLDPLSHIPPTHTSDHGPIKHQASENNRKLGNNHPTVKPVALMRYLIQLVTPAGSRVLDPFMGSGSTGMAARELGHTFVGIDLDPAYVSIAERRILGWCQTEITTLNKNHRVEPTTHADLFDDLFE
jgi:DNA modification methylase